jgi:hypothetical protein
MCSSDVVSSVFSLTQKYGVPLAGRTYLTNISVAPADMGDNEAANPAAKTNDTNFLM